jgi:hypothetical protein
MALRDVLEALAPQPVAMPAIPPPIVAGGMGFPQRSFGMGFTQVAGGRPEDMLGAPELGSITDVEPTMPVRQIMPQIDFENMGAGRRAARAKRPPPTEVFVPGNPRASGFVRPAPAPPAKAINPRAVIGSNTAPMGLMPQLAARYPTPSPPTVNFREGGKAVSPAVIPDWRTTPLPEGRYYGKAKSAEEKALTNVSAKVQKQIEAGNYKPYFDPAKRFDVDPTKYPTRGTATPPKAAKTVAELTARTADPELAQRLIHYYNAGKDDPGAVNWYMMGQLEKEFIKEYGSKEGRVQFQRKFADQMAATTGGSNPTDNFRNAMFANFQQSQGLPAVPEASHQLSSPIGGRYVGGNMAMADKIAAQGLTPENPKRYNFSGNFLGDKNAVTLDEQMSNILKWKNKEFSGPEYRPHEQLVQQVAAQLGIDPRQLQEVAWSGYKKTEGGGSGSKGKRAKPMIEIVNEAIERTSKITGVPPAEVVRQGIVLSRMPLFNAAGIAVPVGVLLAGGSDEAEAAQPKYRTGGRF